MKLHHRRYRIKNRQRFKATLTIIGLIILIITIHILQTINVQTNNNQEIRDLSLKTVQFEPLTLEEYSMRLEPQIEVSEVRIYDIPLSEALQRYTWNETMYHGTSYELQLALMYCESRFDGKADSGSSRGICQINRNTEKGLAEGLRIKDFNSFNEKHNISASIYLIKQLHDYWVSEGYSEEDSTVLSLISYNRGLAGCKKYMRYNNIYSDYYVNKVLGYKSQLEQYGTITE